MFFDFSKAAEERIPHLILDKDEARENAKMLPTDAFAEAVQTLQGNCAEKRDLLERVQAGENLHENEWERLRTLNAAPMDADLFRKVCRTALENKLIPDNEKRLRTLLPNKASKIGDSWPLPSPANCVFILNIFAAIKPVAKEKPAPSWMDDNFVAPPMRAFGRPFGLR